MVTSLSEIFSNFVSVHNPFLSGADLQGGLGGVKPPYLPKTHGYPPKLPLNFLEETMKRKRGGRRREGEEEEESEYEPLYIFELDSTLLPIHMSSHFYTW